MGTFFGFQGNKPKTEEPKQEKTGFADVFDTLKKTANKFVDEVKTQVDAVQQTVNSSTQNVNAHVSVEQCLPIGQEYLRNGNTEKALEMLYKGVRLGSADCALQLYNMYTQGTAVNIDYMKAYFWARMASDLGSAEGTYLAGCLCQSALGFTDGVEIAKAYAYYEKAARAGHTIAAQEARELEKRYVYYYSNDEQLSYEQLKERADQSQTAEECTRYLILMAMQEHDAQAKNWVGLRFLNGQGAPKNYIIAMFWFRKAVEAGSSYAAFNLANMYECGTEVFVDYEEARRYYQIAANRGHITAKKRLPIVEKYLNMTGEELYLKAGEHSDNIYNEVMAHQMFVLAAQKGYERAVLSTAISYRFEMGVRRDYLEAMLLFGRVIMMNECVAGGYALLHLSTMFMLGQVRNVVDVEVANRYYEAARQLENKEALQYSNVQTFMEGKRREGMVSLFEQARMYQRSFVCPVDMQKAYDLYVEAGRHGETRAMLFKACIAAYGFATERNEERMLDYIKEARDHGWSYPEKEPHTAKGILLSYYNLLESARYEEFDVDLAIDAAVWAFRRQSFRLGYAYLSIAKELGADIEPIIKDFDPRKDHCPVELLTVPDVWKVGMRRFKIEPRDEVWHPEDVSEEQVEEIRELVRLNRIEDLYNLGMDYYLERNGRPENGRLAMMCMKLAAEEGFVAAVLGYAYISIACTGGAIPINYPLCKRIIDRFEGIQLRGDSEEAMAFIRGLHADVKSEYERRVEFERNQHEIFLEIDMKKLRDVAVSLEQNHFEEEEWLIKEYQTVIADRNSTNYFKQEISSEAARSEWDELLERDWEGWYRFGGVTYNEHIEFICDWQPDFISDEQLEEIRQLERENKIEEIYQLGLAYVYEDIEPERETCARLAAMCLKIAVDHHHLGALVVFAELMAAGYWGYPQNIEMAKHIIDTVEEEFDLMYIAKMIYGEETVEEALHESSDVAQDDTEEQNDTGEQEIDSSEQETDSPFAGIRKLIAEAETEDCNMSEEDLKRGIESNQQVADKMSADHFDGEEWYIYEYYRLADYRRNRNDISAVSDSLPFKDSKLDIDQILAEMKAEYIKNDVRAEKAEGIHLAEEKEERPSELPENLDAYFEGMIGMDSVKAQLNKIYQTVKIQMMREKALRERGIEPKENEKGYNFILLGNPGTGKTTVARIIAKILYDIQIRETDSFVEIERSSIVGSYIGETEKQIGKVLKNVRGGTLFIDEAYTLYKEDSENDVGAIVIDTLMKDMEDNRNSYSVIMAGYKEPMLNMIRNANSGFSSRFTYVIELPDYSDEALIEIAHMHMDKQKLIACEGVDEAIVKCIHHDKLDQTFGNARYIRELVNRAIENQSERLNAMESFETDDLFELRAEDFWQGTMEEEGVEKYLEELNNLTGLASVKKDVESLIHTITVQQEMEKRGMQVSDSLGTLHMAFKGNPGTGKTTVARILGKLYASLGVLKRGDVFVECTRSDLVGKYQGHTAEKVKKVVESALGGVLFIDEAYSLVQGENDSFGLEAVNELVAEMENKRQNLVVILAGYTDDIDEFLKNNPGLRSRVPKDLFFEDYNMEELYEIALGMLKGKNLSLTEDAKEALRARLFVECMKEDFGNARGVRNIVDKIWREQNVRIANLLKDAAAELTNEMMLQVEKEDIEGK